MRNAETVPNTKLITLFFIDELLCKNAARKVMSESEYKISIYHPNFLHQVVDLLRYLWGNDFDANLHYFQRAFDP